MRADLPHAAVGASRSFPAPSASPSTSLGASAKQGRLCLCQKRRDKDGASAEWIARKAEPASLGRLKRFQVYSPARSRHGYLISHPLSILGCPAFAPFAKAGSETGLAGDNRLPRTPGVRRHRLPLVGNRGCYETRAVR